VRRRLEKSSCRPTADAPSSLAAHRPLRRARQAHRGRLQADSVRPVRRSQPVRARADPLLALQHHHPLVRVRRGDRRPPLGGLPRFDARGALRQGRHRARARRGLHGRRHGVRRAVRALRHGREGRRQRPDRRPDIGRALVRPAVGAHGHRRPRAVHRRARGAPVDAAPPEGQPAPAAAPVRGRPRRRRQAVAPAHPQPEAVEEDWARDGRAGPDHEGVPRHDPGGRPHRGRRQAVRPCLSLPPSSAHRTDGFPLLARSNALPEYASASVNYRIDFLSSVNETLEHISSILAPVVAGLNLTFSSYGSHDKADNNVVRLSVVESSAIEPAPLTPTAGDAWDLMAGTTRHIWEGAVVAPSGMVGASPLLFFLCVRERERALTLSSRRLSLSRSRPQPTPTPSTRGHCRSTYTASCPGRSTSSRTSTRSTSGASPFLALLVLLHLAQALD